MDDEPRANSMSALPQSNTSARTLSQSSSQRDCVPCSSKDPNKGHSIMDSCVTNGLSSSENHLPCVGMPAIKGALYSNNSVSCEPSNAYSSNNSVHNIHVEENGHLHNPVEFGQIFREGYCKISELSDCHDLTEVVTDAESSSSHCEREKTEDDGDNDDMLGGVFAFSEG
eukprot:TRINITY_DN2576_c0_g2_i1.p1 TRINITY_DN2576_c0_g2~~TRINITY_DN2576_c0_g2_i1.p1  ORF type:complete len:191 (-),score=36.59 TRINITY_DN2576_c0_g2_i1:375-884(-)